MSYYASPVQSYSARGHGQQAYSLSAGPSHTPSGFISPTRRRLPQAPYTPSGKWKSATGRTNQVYPSVSFDVPGQSRQGVSLRELKNGGAQLQGAGDRVLRDTGLKRITFRLLVRDLFLLLRVATESDLFPSGPDTNTSNGVAQSSSWTIRIKKHPSPEPSWEVKSRRTSHASSRFVDPLYLCNTSLSPSSI